ncbi:hypothetical protein PoB_004455300 [Plakobranchus ocellatus]|uniref:Secreted protein n=1 Tax=Plakobranchus ocellatus TaxID=259542 RepID=A0AAV4BFW7_9GAST|nr:hypothetical protein PoB_004455300 [Plakobranchus ocellatus]
MVMLTKVVLVVVVMIISAVLPILKVAVVVVITKEAAVIMLMTPFTSAARNNWFRNADDVGGNDDVLGELHGNAYYGAVGTGDGMTTVENHRDVGKELPA